MKIYKRTGKKGKVSYQAFWFEPVRNPGEKPKLKGKCFPTEREAKDWLAKVRVSKKEKRYHDVFDVKKETTITFNQLADEYAIHHRDQRSWKSKALAIEVLKKAFGKKKLSQIKSLDIDRWKKERTGAITRLGRPRERASVNYELATLRHMLNKSVEWEWLETSPFKKGKMFKVDNAKTRFLDEAEIDALLKACGDLKTYSPHLKPIVEVALMTGMRSGEILSLKWEQVRDGRIHLIKTKSGKPRYIPINETLAGILSELR
jgi:integrase